MFSIYMESIWWLGWLFC